MVLHQPKVGSKVQNEMPTFKRLIPNLIIKQVRDQNNKTGQKQETEATP